MMPRAGRGIDGQLGARAEDAPFSHAAAHPVHVQPTLRSVCQARGCLSHRGDRPPYPEPGEQLITVVVPKHPIEALRGLEFGIVAILVEHQVRGAVDVRVREHRVFLRRQNNTQERGRLVEGRVITIQSEILTETTSTIYVSITRPSTNLHMICLEAK